MANLNWDHLPDGQYGADDLNRVEMATNELQVLLKKYGYALRLLIKPDWTRRDFPTQLQMNRVRANIDALQSAYYRLPDWWAFAYNSTLDAAQVNAWEWDLSRLHWWLDRTIEAFRMSNTFAADEQTLRTHNTASAPPPNLWGYITNGVTFAQASAKHLTMRQAELTPRWWGQVHNRWQNAAGKITCAAASAKQLSFINAEITESWWETC